MHFHDKPITTEEENDAKDNDKDDKAALAALVVGGRNLTILELDVSRVLCTLNNEFVIVKLEFLLLEGSLDRHIRLIGDPHVVRSVNLIQMIILELLHLVRNAPNLLELCSFQSLSTLLQLVQHPAIVEAKVDVHDLIAVHLKLARDLLSHALFELHYWDRFRIVLVRQRLDEVGVYLGFELGLSRVVVHRHQSQVKQLVVDLVLVEHLPHERGEDEAHEEADAGGGEAPLVLHHKGLLGLRAGHLREEEHVQALRRGWDARKVLKRHRHRALLLAAALVEEECLEVVLAELSHFESPILWVALDVVVAVENGIHVAPRELRVEHHAR